MDTITDTQLVEYLSNYEVDLLGISFPELKSFITPNTNLYLLTLLSKAENQGLDLVLVDRDKFFSVSYNDKPIKYLEENRPGDGAWYTEIDLSFIMHDTHSFIYEGSFEPMGLDVDMNTLSLIGAAVSHFEIDDNFNWMDAPIYTVADLITYLNDQLNVVKPLKTPGSIYRAYKNKFENSIYLKVIFIPLIWIPYQIVRFIIKQIRNLHQPIGYKRNQ